MTSKEVETLYIIELLKEIDWEGKGMVDGGQKMEEFSFGFCGHQENVWLTLGKFDSGQKQDMGVYGSHVENFFTGKYFHFLSQQPWPFRKPCWPQELVGYLVERIIECLMLSLGLDAMCQGRDEKGTECLIEWNSLQMTIALGAARDQKWERGLTKLFHTEALGLVLWKKGQRTFSLFSVPQSKSSSSKVVGLSEGPGSHRITAKEARSPKIHLVSSITISISPHMSYIGNFIWLNLTIIEISHGVWLSGCGVHSVAEGSPEKAGIILSIQGPNLREVGEGRRAHGSTGWVWTLDSSLDCNPGSSGAGYLVFPAQLSHL